MSKKIELSFCKYFVIIIYIYHEDLRYNPIPHCSLSADIRAVYENICRRRHRYEYEATK